MPYKDIKKRNEYNKIYLREWRKNNRDKVRGYDQAREKHKVAARVAVNEAVRKGKIIRPKFCSNCKQRCKPEAHHPDHNKPLEIVWLCTSCHKEIEKLTVL